MVQRPLTGLAGRVQELQAGLARRDLPELAQACGALLLHGRLQMKVWGTAVAISPPEFVARAAETGEVLDPLTQALVAYHDFPPSYKILFDAHTPHYLPTDACAILGSMLTRRLLSGH